MLVTSPTLLNGFTGVNKFSQDVFLHHKPAADDDESYQKTNTSKCFLRIDMYYTDDLMVVATLAPIKKILIFFCYGNVIS